MYIIMKWADFNKKKELLYEIINDKIIRQQINFKKFGCIQSIMKWVDFP